MTSRKSHRNNVDELMAFLEEKHSGNYVVFNLGCVGSLRVALWRRLLAC